MNIDRDPSVKDDDGAMKPGREKLRSSDPDLKISVGADDEAVDCWYHSNIMANHSNYIDTMLATPKKESKTYEIKFPDIAPSTWELMMTFLEGPVAAVRLMTIEDATEVAPVYDQYDFHLGRELCDQVLKEYFQDKKILSSLDCFVDAVLLADAANLNEAKKVGVSWLHQTFSSSDSRTGSIIFTENHISKLVPLITKEDNLFQMVQAFYGNGIKSKEDLRSPLFPSALVTAYKEWATRRMLIGEVPHIMLSGTGCEADGSCSREFAWDYECNRRGLWDGVQVAFKVCLPSDVEGWAIVGETLPEIDEDGHENYDNVVTKILWLCPNSRNAPLPPRDGWIPVDKLARGEPTVSYRVDVDL